MEEDKITTCQRNTLRMIQVMQAYTENAVIEFNNEGDVWHTTYTPSWNWQDCDYRVKANPHLTPQPEITEPESNPRKTMKMFDLGITAVRIDDIVSIGLMPIGESLCIHLRDNDQPLLVKYENVEKCKEIYRQLLLVCNR